MQPTLEQALREVIELAKGTYLDSEAKRLEDALDAGAITINKQPVIDEATR